MRLDQEIVRRGLCESRTETQGLIESGNVLVNNIVVIKQTKQVSDTDEIKVTSRRKFVSRGGEKLKGAFMDKVSRQKILDNINTEGTDAIRQIVQGKYALDVGSSTGGFTDFLLSYDIYHVDAVDVGSEQLHERLRNDARVSLFENTDIRNFKSENKYDIIVVDLSFIQLKNVLKNIVDFGKSGTYYFLLIKPQFEVGKGNTKKGIVKDIVLVNEVLSEYESLAEELGLKDIKVFPCKIEGGDGNQEYFLVANL